MNLVPTKVSLLATRGVLSTSLGWAIARLWPTWFNQSLSVPWLAAATMCLVAVSLLVWTLMMRPKLNPKPGQPRIDPIVAARTAALAMAASRMGALMSGFYFGIFLVNAANIDAPGARLRMLVSGITVIAGIVTVVIALWLERMCRLPQPPATNSSNVPA